MDVPQQIYPQLQILKKQIIEAKKQAMIKRPDQFQATTGYASLDQVYRQYYTRAEETIDIPPLKMIDFLEACAYDGGFLDEVVAEYFVKLYGIKLTARQFLTRVRDAAKAFKVTGTKKGDRVLIALPNTFEALVSLYALNTIGAVPIMANPMSSVDDFCNYLEIVGNDNHDALKKCVIFNREYPNLVKAMQKSKIQLDNIITVGADTSLTGPINVLYQLAEAKKDPKIPYDDEKIIKWNNFISQNSHLFDDDEELESPYVPNECALILMTGGTTGSEKFAQISNENANAIALQWSVLIKNSGPGDLTLNAMPYFHVFGLLQVFHFSICTGKRSVIIPNPRLNNKEMMGLQKKYSFVNNNAVPGFALNKVLKPLAGTKNVKLLKNTKNMILGGATVSQSDKVFSRKTFAAAGAAPNTSIHEGFGITEGSGGVTYTLIGNDVSGCIGIPSPGTLMKVVNPDTNQECRYGEEGELCFAGPSVFLGYLNNPEETANVLKTDEQGITWMYTGDLGIANPNGTFNFCTRKKRIIIVNGENIYPNRLEDLLKEKCPDINECCVVAEKHAYKGEVPVIKVHLKSPDGKVYPASADAKDKYEQEIRQLCEQSFGKAYKPLRIDFLTQVPLTKKSTPDYRKVIDPNLVIKFTEKGLPTPDNKKERLHKNYDNNAFYLWARKLYGGFYHKTHRTTVIGQANLPQSGATILALNHLHINDHLELMYQCDRIVSFLAKKEYFDTPLIGYIYQKLEMIEVDRFGDAIHALGYAISLIEAIPLSDYELLQPVIKEVIAEIENLPIKEYNKPKLVVEAILKYLDQRVDKAIRSEEAAAIAIAKVKIMNMPTSGMEHGYGYAQAATKKAEEYLGRGRAIGIFPEGTRNKYFFENGRLLPFASSIGYLAHKTGAQIVPSAITGSHKFGGKLILRIDKPIKIDASASDTDVKDAVIYLRDRIAHLVALNLVDQPHEKHDIALMKIIENLQNGIESNRYGTLEAIHDGLSKVDSQRNQKLLRLFR